MSQGKLHNILQSSKEASSGFQSEARDIHVILLEFSNCYETFGTEKSTALQKKQRHGRTGARKEVPESRKDLEHVAELLFIRTGKNEFDQSIARLIKRL